MSKTKEDIDADTSDEDITLDFSKLKRFFSSKTFNVLLVLLLIAIPVVLTVYIRLQPQYLPATDQWARSSVDNYYKNQITQQVNAQYPNLPVAQRTTLINQQFAQFEKSNADQIAQQVKQTSTYFKTGFQYNEDNQTHTFLGDLDSYYWLRQSRLILDHGNVCDVVIDGTCIDTHSLAPIGIENAPSMHPYAIAYWYRFLHALDHHINLMDASFYLPTLLAIFATIAAFFIGRRLMNDVAGFFAAILVSVSPLFLTRSLGSDTDVWNIMLPLVIVWLCIEAFESKELWKKAVFAGIAGLMTGAFAFAWASGYWYIFDFIIAAIIAYFVFEMIRSYISHKRLTKSLSQEATQLGILLIVFVLSAGIFVSAFTSFDIFKSAFTAPLSLSAGLKAATSASLWPNVYTTVAELNTASISTIIDQTSFGVPLLFSLALLGVILLMVKRKPDAKGYWLVITSAVIYLFLVSQPALRLNTYAYLILLMLPVIAGIIMLLYEKESVIDVKLAVLLTIWFVGMIYASTQGVRFILLLTPAFGIALGVALGYLYQYFARLFNDGFKMPEKIAKLAVFILLCLIIIAPVQIGITAGKTYMPSMTKGWWDTLTNIREKSAPNAIINSWWDFGHWFKYVADRQVTLDGNIQNHPNAHWLGRILQTNNETEAVGILRMLDCGSNNAFEEVNKKYNDTEKAQNVIADIIMMDTITAKNHLLSLGFTQEETDKILSLSKCTPPEDYFITSEDMVGKAGVWAHFGVWDFDKAFIINNIRGQPVDKAVQVMKDRWNYSTDEATKIYYDVQALQTDQDMNNWIAPWPSYAGQKFNCQKTGSDTVTCPLGIGIGNNGQAIVVLDRATVNLTDPANSSITVGFYDQTTNQRLGENTAQFKEIVMANDHFKKYAPANGTIGLSLLIQEATAGNQTTYYGLVADPLLIDSMFTRLFFLDGQGTTHFEKFSDTTDITGTRIIVWKVKW